MTKKKRRRQLVYLAGVDELAGVAESAGVGAGVAESAGLGAGVAESAGLGAEAASASRRSTRRVLLVTLSFSSFFTA